MKQYNKLPIPKDSAWDRFRWGRYVHWRIRDFFKGIRNIIRWIPTLYKDRDWDDYFITKMLQKKIEFQREHLINANRHTEIDRDNRYMTLALNLIEREHEEFYTLEKYDYEQSDLKLEDVEGMPKHKSVKFELKWENLDAYLAKYPGAVRRVKKMYPDKDLNDKQTLALFVGMYNQERCHKLLYKVLERHIQSWWD